ncbi:bifunctional 3-(3-hydroxy-phenyl)propionate/3-hydroxycinnamic acid hydroxylase [Dactylosporangium siamense]|uniref:3-(3-hydroxyphenyl)propionate hydroxylase n=1 Tax=Dactylosporangium siamense TaxID=685454 RepID=A0A919PZF2_9ACTN|nr:bifunctional 3-(3-hydroxy-phenyl)propionate/3-hydroxycinnamic acid hydroxylase [Dactylosporangium siamense]GIG51110.1 3-(3-hydroxyphenyl)propionate hydroxylase [Dactylosporangium siamense]
MDPVVIVGAGPVGAASAILLAQRGVPCLLLDRYPTPYPLPRAVHVDDEVMRILQELGIAARFAEVSRPGLGLRLLDGRHRVMAEFRRDPGPGPHGWPQANMFDQPDLERLLRDRVAELPLIEFRGGVTVTAVTSTSVTYTAADGERTVAASAVLGCDGANSTVRSLIGATLEDLGFEERWLVVDGVTDRDLAAWGGVHQVCDPRRAATFMQLGRHRYRWEFRLHDGEPGLDEPALLAPWLDGAEVTVVRSAEYTFRARIAFTWRRDRVFLLGDAAHQTPPFIGQGLGAGLRDAHNLAWKLAATLSEGSPALLDSYQRERKPHARAQIRLAIVAGWAMTGGQDRAAAVRRVVLGAVWRLPGLKGLALRSTSPPLRQVGRGRRAGTLAPQPTVVWEGRDVPLDDVLGPGWAVLCRPGVLLKHGRARVVWVTPSLDPTGALRRWMGRRRTVLLRPDRVVAGNGWTPLAE